MAKALTWPRGKAASSISAANASCCRSEESPYAAQILAPLQACLRRGGCPIPLSNQSSGTEARREVVPSSQRSCSTPPPQCVEAISRRFQRVPPSVLASDPPHCEAGLPSVLQSCAVWTLPPRHKCRKERLLITVVYAAFFLARGTATSLLSPESRMKKIVGTAQQTAGKTAVNRSIGENHQRLQQRKSETPRQTRGAGSCVFLRLGGSDGPVLLVTIASSFRGSRDLGAPNSIVNS